MVERDFVIFEEGSSAAGEDTSGLTAQLRGAQKDLEFAITRENAVSHSNTNQAKHHTTYLNQNSNTFATTVSIGAINLKWTWGGKRGGPPYDETKDRNGKIWQMEWFPRVVKIVEGETFKDGVYRLVGKDENSPPPVLIPYHAMAPHNIGHLIWDDLLPLFTLSTLFQSTLPVDPLAPGNLALFRYVFDGREGKEPLWATCDWGKEPTLSKNKYVGERAKRARP